MAQTKQVGRIVAVRGPIVDVKFDPESPLPPIYDIIETRTAGGGDCAA